MKANEQGAGRVRVQKKEKRSRFPIPDSLGKCKMIGETKHSVAFICVLLVMISSLCIDASGSDLFQPQKNKGKFSPALQSSSANQQPQIPKSSRQAGTIYEQEKRKVHTGPNPLHNR